jgi:hypothetical protein
LNTHISLESRNGRIKADGLGFSNECRGDFRGRRIAGRRSKGNHRIRRSRKIIFFWGSGLLIISGVMLIIDYIRTSKVQEKSSGKTGAKWAQQGSNL